MSKKNKGLKSRYFDNFTILMSKVSRYKIDSSLPFDIESLSSKSATKDGKDLEPYLAVMRTFWRIYYKKFELDFLKEATIKFEKNNNFVASCLINIPAFKQYETTKFNTFLYKGQLMYNFTGYYEDIISFDLQELASLIKRLSDQNRIDQWYVFLAYWVYYHDYVATSDAKFCSDELQLTLQTAYNQLSKSKTKKDFNLIFAQGLKKANDVLKELGSMTFTEEITKNFPLVEELLLPAKNITFMDGYVWLYHPQYPNGEHGHLPFRYSLRQSRKVFSHISDYIVRKLPPISVFVRSGTIIGVVNSIDLCNCIDIIERCSEEPAVKQEKPKPKLERKDLTATEAKALIRKLKSRYLDYLCNCQEDGFKVVYCFEQRSTVSGACEHEDSFIFTINSNKLTTFIVFENVNESRSTYIIELYSSRYDTCIDVVFNYFASGLLNKRQKIANGELKIDHPGVRNMYRLFHKNYLNWCDSIKRYRYCR